MQVVIFVGIQGAGKSTFYRDRFSDTHVRINLDMLKTRNRETTLYRACLDCRQSVVIDNTNPSVADRQRYISLAKSAGAEVVGYYFSSRVAEALQRNAQRDKTNQVPDKAILGTSKKLVLPTRTEGFDSLNYVSWDANEKFVVSEWNDEL